MRRSIGRPARALLPLILGALCLGPHGPRAAALALSILSAQLFSLGAAAAFQAAAGKIVREARLRGNFLAAIFLALLGGAASAWALFSLKLPGIGLWMALSGGLIMLTELFSNRLYALTDKLSAPFCDGLTAALTAAGLAASRGDEGILFFFTLAALLACAAAAFGIGGIASPRPGLQVIAEIPRALLRAWVPNALLVGFFVAGRGALPSAFAALGWALLSWAYAPARRAEGESRPTTILTSLAASAAALLPLVCPAVQSFPTPQLLLPLLAACLLTALLHARLSPRGFLALLAYTLAFAMVPPAALIAALLIVPDILMSLRLALAKRRRKAARA